MFILGGNNEFDGNQYDDLKDISNWSAPVYETPNELMIALSEAKIIGRTIKSMRFVNHLESIGNCDISSLDNAKEFVENYDDIPWMINKIPEMLGPFIMEFEDGDRWEFEFGDDSSFRFSMNCLPEGLHDPINWSWDFDPNVIFEEIIGKEIFNIGVTSSLKHYDFDFNGLYKKERDPQDSYIDTVTLSIAPGMALDIWKEELEYNWYVGLRGLFENDYMVMKEDQLRRIFQFYDHES